MRAYVLLLAVLCAGPAWADSILVGSIGTDSRNDAASWILRAVEADDEGLGDDGFGDDPFSSASLLLVGLGTAGLQLYARRPRRARREIASTSRERTLRAVSVIDLSIVLAVVGFVAWVLVGLARDIRAELAAQTRTDRFPILIALSIGSLAAFTAIAVTGEPRIVFVTGMIGLGLVWLIQAGTSGARR